MFAKLRTLLRSNLSKFLLFTWVYLWIWFVYRSWFLKEESQNNLHVKYSQILRAQNLQERIEAVAGADIYGFIRFCQDTLPAQATYRIEGIEPLMDYFRVVYFLYPMVPARQSPDYLLVYNDPTAQREGFMSEAVLEDKHAILIRKKGHGLD